MAEYTEQTRQGTISKFPVIGLILAVLAIIAAIGAGFGYRWDLWHFRTGFVIMRYGGYVGLAAAIVSIVGIVMAFRKGVRRQALPALIGLFISLSLVVTLYHWYEAAKSVPRIHDITTDTENPPAFVAVLPLRKDAQNPPEYGGPEIAKQQKEAYPEIVPLVLNIPPDQAFEKALTTARDVMCWEIVDVNKAQGRIEATDTTFWYGFKDDIVIRITQVQDGSRIDIRSVSRVGISDVGTNAIRIKKFLKRLKKEG